MKSGKFAQAVLEKKTVKNYTILYRVGAKKTPGKHNFDCN